MIYKNSFKCQPIAALVACCSLYQLVAAQEPQAKSIPSPALSPVDSAAAVKSIPGGAVVNQPVVLNSFESVELERLRIVEEVGKSERENADFQAQLLQLQKKLAGASFSAAAPESIPADFTTFLNSDASQITASVQYYALLQQTLNLLTPESPYTPRSAQEAGNPQKAAENLLELAKSPEDDGISRTIRGQISEFFGGRMDDRVRRGFIERELKKLASDKRYLERNYKFTFERSGLTGKPSGSDADRKIIQTKIDAVTEKETQLKAEANSLSHVVKEGFRKLQFQQYIVELALQQRFIHALIACGFYRGSPARGDMSLPKEAYPQGRSRPVPAGMPSADIPVIATITGLEAFLTNRIKDSIKDRDALDNMLKAKRLTQAEAVVRKMTLIGKYQPELHTLPFESRQVLLTFGKQMRGLSDALTARDYDELKKLSEAAEAVSDVSFKDIRQFAAEQPQKALHTARQAQLAMKAGEHKSAMTLIDAARKRAPMDKTVSEKIESFQNSLIRDSDKLEELKKVVDSNDYKTAFERASEFSVLATKASQSGQTELKQKFEALFAIEKQVRTTLEKCETFELRGSIPDSWITLAQAPPTTSGDARINARKAAVVGKAPKFIAAYQKATEMEGGGKPALALAWFLTALAEAPGNPDLVDNINRLAAAALNK